MSIPEIMVYHCCSHSLGLAVNNQSPSCFLCVWVYFLIPDFSNGIKAPIWLIRCMRLLMIIDFRQLSLLIIIAKLPEEILLESTVGSRLRSQKMNSVESKH